MSKREESCEIKNAKYGRRKRMMKRLRENERRKKERGTAGKFLACGHRSSTR